MDPGSSCPGSCSPARAIGEPREAKGNGMYTINAAVWSVITYLRDHKGNDRGATAVEYGLMVALIAAVVAGIVFALGNSLHGTFSSVNDCVNTPAGCNP